MRPSRLRRALALAAALCALPVAAGCSDPGAAHGHASRTPQSPAARTTSPADLCAILIVKWGRDVYDLGKEPYGDYQNMGLSNGQYTILLDVLKAARAERERHGAAAGRKLMQRQAREKCAVRYRDGGPGGNPW
ncbi:hypothetical protein [Streptomyces flavofungini]|uniref:hypothetical protein n=1 Tax=Streptomyces flavofungini TaxID=68200 RepID=UPI0025AFE949|nr:hypothetical protein [Streptomyces flavofungini]WJV49415.1 hypothetical protein QUY26_30215 [Streptomyces flavofungini]